jgi:glutamine cyclotransferase
MKTIITSIERPTLRRVLCTFFVGASALWALPGNIQAGNIVWVTTPGTNSIAKYKADGTVIKTNFITAYPYPNQGGILDSGGILYVATASQSGQQVIATYNAKTGAVIKNPLFFYTQGTDYLPEGLVLSGTNLYVANHDQDSIAKIDTTTGTGNANFITGIANGPPQYPYALAVKGNILYVTNNYGNSNGDTYISEYDATSGALINANFIQFPFTGLVGLALKNNILYVSVFGGNSGIAQGVYTYNATTGALIKGPFVSVKEPYGIAISGKTLYVVSYHDYVIYEFDAATGAKLSNSIVLNTVPTNLTVEPAKQQ